MDRWTTYHVLKDHLLIVLVFEWVCWSKRKRTKRKFQLRWVGFHNFPSLLNILFNQKMEKKEMKAIIEELGKFFFFIFYLNLCLMWISAKLMYFSGWIELKWCAKTSFGSFQRLHHSRGWVQELLISIALATMVNEKKLC